MAIKHELICDVTKAPVVKGLTFTAIDDIVHIQLIDERELDRPDDTPVATGIDTLLKHPGFRAALEDLVAAGRASLEALVVEEHEGNS